MKKGLAKRIVKTSKSKEEAVKSLIRNKCCVTNSSAIRTYELIKEGLLNNLG